MNDSLARRGSGPQWPASLAEGAVPGTQEPDPIFRHDGTFSDFSDDILHYLFEYLDLPTIYSLRFLCRRISPVASGAFLGRCRSVLRAKNAAIFCAAVNKIRTHEFMLSLVGASESKEDSGATNLTQEERGARLALWTNDPLTPFSVGKLFKHLEIPGDSSVVLGVLRGCEWLEPNPFAALLRGMSASVEDIRSQLDASDFLQSYRSSVKITNLRFIRSLGLHTKDQLELVCSLNAIHPEDRWITASKLLDWKSYTEPCDLSRFTEFYRYLKRAEPDGKSFSRTLEDVLKSYSANIRIAALLALSDRMNCGRTLARLSMYGDDRTSASTNAIKLLRGILEYSLKVPGLPPLRPLDFRDMFVGCHDAQVRDWLAPELFAKLLRDDVWPKELPIQASDIGLSGTTIPVGETLACIVHQTGRCSLDRLLAFARSLGDVPDKELIGGLQMSSEYGDDDRKSLTWQAARVRTILTATGCSSRVWGAIAVSRAIAAGKAEPSDLDSPSSHPLSFYIFERFDWDPSNGAEYSAEELGDILGWSFVQGTRGREFYNIHMLKSLGAVFLDAQINSLLEQVEMPLSVDVGAEMFKDLRLRFLNGFIERLLNQYGRPKTACFIGAMLQDSLLRWFPPQAVDDLGRHSQVFRSLFETYRDVVNFLSWYAFAGGALGHMHPEYPGQPPVRTLITYGLVRPPYNISLIHPRHDNPDDPIPEDVKKDLFAGGLVADCAIGIVWSDRAKANKVVPRNALDRFGPLGKLKPSKGSDGWDWEGPKDNQDASEAAEAE